MIQKERRGRHEQQNSGTLPGKIPARDEEDRQPAEHGRKQDEVAACLKELKLKETDLQKWSDSTIEVTASKYLTLLKKFNLMVGSVNKTIIHPYLDDKMFILFVYWLVAIETKSNILNSSWLNYCFSEKPFFIERILQKKFIKFFHINYTGDRLSIEPIISYENIYHAITQS